MGSRTVDFTGSVDSSPNRQTYFNHRLFITIQYPGGCASSWRVVERCDTAKLHRDQAASDKFRITFTYRDVHLER